jgi:hypothetical protein
VHSDHWTTCLCFTLTRRLGIVTGSGSTTQQCHKYANPFLSINALVQQLLFSDQIIFHRVEFGSTGNDTAKGIDQRGLCVLQR